MLMKICSCLGKSFSDCNAIAYSSTFKDLEDLGNIVVLDFDDAGFGPLFSLSRLSLPPEHHLLAVIARKRRASPAVPDIAR